MLNIAVIYKAQKDYGKAEELYERALEGHEAQLGKDHKTTKLCVRNLRNYYRESGNSTAMAELKRSHSNIDNY